MATWVKEKFRIGDIKYFFNKHQ